ncbi:hypothetical protein A7A55_15245 [Acinetobacter baumannii]|nr:hypothetical protein A7A55_15245 [Acinetobacter baumannii]
MFANFPFAFAIDLEAGGINDQVSHRALAGEAVLDVDGLGALADTAKVNKKAKKMEAIVSASNEAMSQIINTISSSIVALDSNKKMNINNGICSS